MIKINNNKIFYYYIPLGLIFIVIFLFIFIYHGAKKTDASWYSSSGTWSYRKQITIDHTKVSGSSNLSDFPVLISVTDNDFKYISSGGKIASSTGGDLVFTSSDGTTKLDYEIEKYASTTGETIAWVRIPSLSPTTDTTIYVYFGNASAPYNQNPTGVWDSNYKGVWHMKDATGNNIVDSTNNNTATPYNSPTQTPGKIDGSLNFLWNGSHRYATSPNSSSLNNINSQVTISAWVNLTGDNIYNVITCYTGGSGTDQFWFAITENNASTPRQLTAYLGGTNSPGWHLGIGSIQTNTPQYVTMTYNSSTGKVSFYINGALDVQRDDTGTMSSNSYNYLHIATNWDNSSNWFQGSLDEVRISNTSRSDDWIKTEYNNQSSPNTFYSYGALTQQNRDANVAGAGISTKGGSLGWYSTSGTWSYRKQITIDHTKVGVGTTTPLTNFPMLFSVTDSDLKYTGSGGKIASSTGGDLVFTSSDGTTKLDYEIEKYASTTGETIAWVRIPSLSPTTDTTIYVYFGNASAPYNQNPTGVWDSNYKGVWHLPNGTSLTANDSTSNGNNGTNSGATAGVGKIDGGGVVSNSQYIDLGGSSSLNPTIITISGWVNKVSSSGDWHTIIGRGNSVGYQVGFYGNNVYFASYVSGWAGTPASSNAQISAGSWQYISGVYDGSNYKIYINGSEITSDRVSRSGTITYSGASNPNIGRSTIYDYFNGSFDEMRISNTSRSDDWIKTEYNNQSSPSTFYAYGSLQVNARQNSSSSATPAVKTRGGVKFR